MAELKMISPLLSNMEVERCVSTRGGASVYIVRSTKSNHTYILKHISVPESQKQVDALRFTGAAETDEDAQKYYAQVVADYTAELETLEGLAASSNIACYRSYQIEPKEDAIGFDLYLLAEDRKTLSDYIDEHPMTRLAAANLALDLCQSLTDLRAAGFVHRDVKPSNIYLNVQNHFALGDLGLAKLDELKYSAMPESMLSSYSAPELFDLVGTIDPTSDIYSVGMILYRIFNGNHGPFEDERTSAKAADKRRIGGEALPAPMYADYEIGEIILKACAFAPEDRYADPEQMKQELVEYVKRNQLDDALIVPPIIADSEPIVLDEEEEEIEPVQFADTEEMSDDFKQNFSPDTAMLNSIIDAVHRQMDEDEVLAEEDDEQVEPSVLRARKLKRLLPKIVIPALLAVIIAACVYFFIIAPSTIHVESISLVSQDTESLTVLVDSSEKDGSFGVICADAYGNTYRQSYLHGENNTFDNLVPGTQYTFTVEPMNNEKLSGDYTLRVSTIAESEVLSFTATAVSLTQVELNLTLNGPEPELWTVSYTGEGLEPQTVQFSGHSTTVANLAANTDYTFTLLQPDGVHLTGVTEATYSTVPTVEIKKLNVAISSNTAILSWTIEGEAPEYWTVDIEGESGFTDTKVISDPAITFEELTSGEKYTITISAPTMLRSGTIDIVPTVIEITDMTAETDADGNMLVTWLTGSEPTENTWKVTWKPVGAKEDAAQSAEVTGEMNYTIDKTKLLPQVIYEITLSLANGDAISGKTQVDAQSELTERFKEHGLNQTYIGMYLRPNKETWTYLDLFTPTSNYTTEQSIAFALQTIQNIQKSSDSINVTLALLASDGRVYDSVTDTYTWDSMWNNNLFVGEFPRTPQDAGSYILRLYFNGQYVAESPLTVK